MSTTNTANTKMSNKLSLAFKNIVNRGMVDAKPYQVWQSLMKENGVASIGFLKYMEKTERGMYRIPDSLRDSVMNMTVQPSESVAAAPGKKEIESVSAAVAFTVRQDEETTISYVPLANPHYVAWGSHSTLKKIIGSDTFFPTYITGMSGNGKSEMVMQICSSLNRECLRINIDSKTGEDSLIGHFELIDGSYVWVDGPVLIAMKRGAVLLLDELDAGKPENLFCIQSVLEGGPVFVKKRNLYVYPEKGFNIVATANTKGRGSVDGKFIGVQLQNEAMLDRFAITIEQTYPTPAIEKKILASYAESLQVDDGQFIENIVKWAGLIRSAFDSGACDDLISTRRLIDIVRAHSIFNNRKQSVELCISRFEQNTKQAFYDFFASLVGDGETKTEIENIPF